VDYKIHIIDQHPFGLGITLDVRRAQAGLLQAQLDFIGNGLHLPRIGSAAKHKVVGKRSRPFFHFQDAEFFGLFFQAGLNGGGNLLLEFARFIHSKKNCRSDLIVTEVSPASTQSHATPSYATPKATPTDYASRDHVGTDPLVRPAKRSKPPGMDPMNASGSTHAPTLRPDECVRAYADPFR
jgi:hypothetical protein